MISNMILTMPLVYDNFGFSLIKFVNPKKENTIISWKSYNKQVTFTTNKSILNSNFNKMVEYRMCQLFW